MLTRNTRLKTLRPIKITNYTTGEISFVPQKEWFHNIPVMWEFLGRTVNDWQRDITPYSEGITGSSTENERLIHTHNLLVDIEIPYLHRAFSYVMFFAALKHAYDLVFEELNTIASTFVSEQPSKPYVDSYIKTVLRVRNVGVVHVGERIDDKRASRITRTAAAIWRHPMSVGGPIDGPLEVEKVAPIGLTLVSKDANGKAIRSEEVILGSIPEIHERCIVYLDRYDQTCSDLLNSCLMQLPITQWNNSNTTYT